LSKQGRGRETLAYLLPALRMCAANGHRVIISTGTKNLQEQLFFKDVPFLESLLGPLRVLLHEGARELFCAGTNCLRCGISPLVRL